MPASPLLVTGTGGSGTRAFARLAAATGRCMGAHQSEANDALALFRLADRWCAPVYTDWSSGKAPDHPGFEADLKRCLDTHLSERPAGMPWGWKQPRSLYLLPALAAALPEMLVVHVVRDGRDIAFGRKTSHGIASAYTAPPEAAGQPTAVRRAMMWAGSNELAAAFGEERLGERYLRLRLEDLCSSPEKTADRLVDFAEGAGIAPDLLHSIVQPPPTLGRWRGANPMLLASVTEAASPALRRFGYLG